MKVTTGASENQKLHYTPRTVPKPPKELQILVFPFIEWFNNSLNDLDAYDPRPTAWDLLDFMERGKDFAQLINIWQAQILFDYEFFKTDLLLKYKENMGTFCSTGLNKVSK